MQACTTQRSSRVQTIPQVDNVVLLETVLTEIATAGSVDEFLPPFVACAAAPPLCFDQWKTTVVVCIAAVSPG